MLDVLESWDDIFSTFESLYFADVDLVRQPIQIRHLHFDVFLLQRMIDESSQIMDMHIDCVECCVPSFQQIANDNNVMETAVIKLN